MIHRLISLLFLLFCFVAVQAQSQDEPGYNIEITVQGMENKNLMLAYYFNESTYTRDTARSNANGTVVFKGSEKLLPGVYILVQTEEKSKLFDFAVYNDQHFSLSTVNGDLYRSMKVEGDINNQLFFSNLIYNADKSEIANPLTLILQDENSTEQEKNDARAKVEAINKEVLDYQRGIISKHPNTLVSKILQSRLEFVFPDHLKVSTEENNQERYYYYKENFWNNVDLKDDGLLRLPFPLIQEKIDEYFDKIVLQDPDTIIKEIEYVVGKTKSNSETYKFMVWSLTSKYYAPPVMGLDKVFVHLHDTYFDTGEMDYWANQQLKDNVKERADKLRLSMIGMKAPDLRMLDGDLRARSMYDIRSKYTVLYFYDPDCGHCKEETPVLVDFTNKTTFDVQVFSVCADTSMVKMNNYIADVGMDKWVNVNGPRSFVGHYQDLYDAFQTPTLYLLNEEKEIIAKKLPAAKLEEFLQQYEQLERD